MWPSCAHWSGFSSDALCKCVFAKVSKNFHSKSKVATNSVPARPHYYGGWEIILMFADLLKLCSTVFFSPLTLSSIKQWTADDGITQVIHETLSGPRLLLLWKFQFQLSDISLSSLSIEQSDLVDIQAISMVIAFLLVKPCLGPKQ